MRIGMTVKYTPEFLFRRPETPGTARGVVTSLRSRGEFVFVRWGEEKKAQRELRSNLLKALEEGE